MILLCVEEGGSDERGNLLKFTRSNVSEPFASPQIVEIEGLPKFRGRFPRYVLATRELFFLQADGAKRGVFHLIIIMNFTT